MATGLGYTSFTLQQLDTLNAAIIGGTRSVYYGDKRVEYRSLDEMLQIRRLAMLELGLTTKTSGTSFATFEKGIQSNCSQSPDSDYNDPSYNAWH